MIHAGDTLLNETNALSALSISELFSELGEKLLSLVSVHQSKNYNALLIEGSDAVGIEKLLRLALTRRHHLLVVVNGIYGIRISRIVASLGLRHSCVSFGDDEADNLGQIRNKLLGDSSITHVAAVHCEVMGQIFPLQEIANLCKTHRKIFLVDASNSFGLLNIPIEKLGIDILFSTSRNRLRSLPGISFSIVHKQAVRRLNKLSESFMSSFFKPWFSFSENGHLVNNQPVESLISLKEALNKLESRRGISSISARYVKNLQVLQAGMSDLGFSQPTSPENNNCMTKVYLIPEDRNFDYPWFSKTVNREPIVMLKDDSEVQKRFLIALNSYAEEKDIHTFLKSAKSVLAEMGCLLV